MAENENAGEQDKSKIIIDQDWKSQAQAEKQRLAEEVEKKTQEARGAQAAASGAQTGAGQAGQQGREREIPPASFNTLVSFLATQAMMSMGGMQDRRTGRAYVDLDLAKHYIDTLAVIETKTQGNLDDEEKTLLDQVLYELRMQYVDVAQRAAEI